MDQLPPKQLIASIYQQLLPSIQIESVSPVNPVQVDYLPKPWQILGLGNYAAVVYHPHYSDLVIKIYAPGRPGYEKEVEVYRRLGSHKAFSKCLYAKDNFLVLERLYGTTLYDCVHLGLYIPQQVINDIDDALNYAQSRGLYPNDVHGRNVMMLRDKGLVVDVSDFLEPEICSKWNDLKRAYYMIYLPIIAPLRLHLSYSVLDIIRRYYRRLNSFRKTLNQIFF
ncbi:serine/threonine protein kinase (plasmid) [Cyanobacterium sp. IPPAS B-1200]|uniref:serine/threonine protein kinase n=1 Tax=Cyanobacterium sp. IPPAS B-1200 TaxID=1562720 RepID=UPI0008524816|nr:serine/threonine protein kinase [Cyanobacterium sp. IPPAS B-1200]OEJ77836.1 serine/threonine protein kinase [Cyanobacterium sp. IPPAS B-1200]